MFSLYSLARFFRRLISFVSSLIGAVITIAATTTQPVISLFCGTICSSVAWVISLAIWYYAYNVGLFGYVIGFSLVCVACGVIGTPLFLIQSAFAPAKRPEPKVKFVVEHSTAQTKPKKAFVAAVNDSIFRIPFRIVLLFVAILDTLISTTFLEQGEQRKGANRMWDILYEKKEQFYEYEEVYGGDVENDYPDELWVHINGILTNLDGGKSTCRRMYGMFGRPVKLLHNPTDGPGLDLLECFMGKTGLLKHGATGPRKLLKEKLLNEMKKDYKKIVLVAHSQGTIITGNVIADFNDIVDGKGDFTDEERALIKENLSKMEVYIVAGAAHYVNGKYVSHLECISNRGDFVAVLGHVFPKYLKPFWMNTKLSGIHYSECSDVVETAGWGHMLGDHYFTPMEKGSFPGSKLVTTYLKKSQEESATETSKLLS